jgi:hypothetical protein
MVVLLSAASTMVYLVMPEGYTVAVTERNKVALSCVATR